MNFIKNNYKWIFSILLIGLGYFCWSLFEKNRQLEKDKSRLEDNLSISKEQISEVEIRSKELAYEVESSRLRQDELKRTNIELYNRLTDFSKKVDKIESYMKVVTQTIGKIEVPLKDSFVEVYKPDLSGLVVVDTVQRIKSFNYNDGFLVQRGYLLNDSLFSDYSYTSELEGVLKWKNQGFFKDDKLVLDIVSKNPKEKVVGLESIKIKQPEKKFYEKSSFKFGSGVVIGLGLATGIYYLLK